MQSFDRLIGPWLCRLFRSRARQSLGGAGPVEPREIRQILIIRPGGMGDAALLLPMVAALGRGIPGAAIDILAERRNAGIFALTRHVREVICYDDGLFGKLRDLRSKQYDIVIDTEQFHHLSVLLANALRPRYLCGFASASRECFLTHPVRYRDEDYEAESFLHLAEALLGDIPASMQDSTFIEIDAESSAWADDILGVARARRVIAIAPLAGGPSRIWPAERYTDIANRLTSDGHFVVLLGGQDAVMAATQIEESLTPDSCLNLAGRTSVAQTAAVLGRSALLVCADTGVLHVAAGLGTPTVSIFGSGLHRKWAPRGERHALIRKNLSCSPCIKGGRLPRCPHQFACMQTIEADEVMASIGNLLNR